MDKKPKFASIKSKRPSNLVGYNEQTNRVEQAKEIDWSFSCCEP